MPSLALAKQPALVHHPADFVGEAVVPRVSCGKPESEYRSSLGVPADLALDLPRRERASIELKASDPTPGLLVRVFFQTHVVLDDSDDVVPAGDNGPVGEGEQGIEVVAAEYDEALEVIVAVYGLEVGGYGAYEVIVDEDGRGKRF